MLGQISKIRTADIIEDISTPIYIDCLLFTFLCNIHATIIVTVVPIAEGRVKHRALTFEEIACAARTLTP